MLWSVGKGVVWSWHRGKLYTVRASSDTPGHAALHVRHSIPTHGPAFDAVPRGRALVTDRYKVIEVVSPGRFDHIPQDCYNALVKHLGLEGQENDVLVLEPGWDNEAA